MPNAAFIAMGDAHLEELIWRRYRQISGDAEMAFTALVDLAIEHFLPLVLLGDVWDTVKPPPSMLRFFRQQMDRLHAEGIAVYAIQGNHDKRDVPWYVAVHDHVQHIGDGRPVTINGLRCRGYDYQLREQIQQRLVEVANDPPQCLFLHQACKQALNFDGAWNCDLEWVPEGIPLVLMGDIHKYWRHTIRAGQTAYYTGTTHPRDLSQLGSKAAMVVMDDLTVEQLPLPVREIQLFKVSCAVHLRDVTDWITATQAMQQPLPPVAFLRYVPDMAAEVLAIDLPGGILIREPVASPEELEFDIDTPVHDGGPDVSVEGLLSTIVDPETKPEVFSLVLDMIQGTDTVHDVLRIHKRKHYEQE